MPEDGSHEAPTPERDAALAAALFAVDPVGIGGVVLRARPGPEREGWLELLRTLLPEDCRIRRLPSHITDDRLLGGLDLAATLGAGRRIAERGVLASADGGVVLIPLAERLSSALAARIASVIDRGEVVLERDGLARTLATRFGVVALDEGIDPDERPPASLTDRLGFHLDLDGMTAAVMELALLREDIARARDALVSVAVSDEAVEALCGAAFALGISSLNAPYLALRAASAAAALDDAREIAPEHITAAARLVLAPRATVVPVTETSEEETQAEPEPRDSDGEGDNSTALGDMVVAAAKAAIPANLLAMLMHAAGRSRSSTQGRAGEARLNGRRGSPAGTRRDAPRGEARLNIVETLRAAAPWQPVRSRSHRPSTGTGQPRRIAVRPDDFRFKRFKERSETVTIFVVDASGSSALHRLAEAKGAVELLLADCYVRRDQVAVFSFGGRGVELLLPPTRSLTRAKRRLADLPGGGGTPLAAAIEKAGLLADAVRRKHQTPAIVVLTDGRPNLARDGGSGRQAGEADALAAATALRAAGVASLLIDTSVKADAAAVRIAEAMGARYVKLPHADARAMSEIVRAGLSGSAA